MFVESRGWGVGGGESDLENRKLRVERQKKRISGKEFQVGPKEEEGCVQAAGCAAVVLDLTGCIFAACAPHPATPAVCAH